MKIQLDDKLSCTYSISRILNNDIRAMYERTMFSLLPSSPKSGLIPKIVESSPLRKELTKKGYHPRTGYGYFYLKNEIIYGPYSDYVYCVKAANARKLTGMLLVSFGKVVFLDSAQIYSIDLETYKMINLK